jgi:hypothetical protein
VHDPYQEERTLSDDTEAVPARVRLDSDDKVSFLVTVSPVGATESQRLASLGNKVVKLTKEQFTNAIQAAASVVKVSDTEFKSAGLAGTKASIEMGLEFTLGGDVKIVQGSAKSTLKVKLDWTI